MIQCPHCEMGLLWGIYLDIPPEMKEGKAEWMACEPPEGDTLVTCPKCGVEAGTYQELYQASAKSRRLANKNVFEEKRKQVSIRNVHEFQLLGCMQTGNYQRDSFLKNSWENLAQFLQNLYKERVIPKTMSDLAEGTPGAIGLRLDDPEEKGSANCRYLATIPISDKYLEKVTKRLEVREYNDPKGTMIYTLSVNLYADFLFQGPPNDFHSVQKFLIKNWLPQEPFLKKDSPVLEFYSEKITSWPPLKKDEFEISVRFLMPIEEAPEIPTEEPQEETQSEDLPPPVSENV